MGYKLKILLSLSPLTFMSSSTSTSSISSRTSSSTSTNSSTSSIRSSDDLNILAQGENNLWLIRYSSTGYL